jgi:hypothetical protein
LVEIRLLFHWQGKSSNSEKSDPTLSKLMHLLFAEIFIKMSLCSNYIHKILIYVENKTTVSKLKITQ